MKTPFDVKQTKLPFIKRLAKYKYAFFQLVVQFVPFIGYTLVYFLLKLVSGDCIGYETCVY
jgi:hypothetical protein